MRNKLAIAITVAVLITTMGALAATFVAVWPDEAEPVATSVGAFRAIEVGQSAPGPQFVGPQLPTENEPVADRDDSTPRPAPAPQPAPPKRNTATNTKWKPAVLQVVTNFQTADVRVNGLPYPEHFDPDEPQGMVLPAGGPYNVEVKFGNSTKVYNLHLRPHETRLLLVELSGINSGAPTPPPPQRAQPVAKKEEPKAEAPAKEETGDGGKITVYSKPAGSIIVDGRALEDKTPGTVDLENGRHEVQVKYETGSVSEKKIVRVRNGSRIKLFFRERQN